MIILWEIHVNIKVICIFDVIKEYMTIIINIINIQLSIEMLINVFLISTFLLIT